MAIAIALGVVAYAGFLAAVIWLSVKWSAQNIKKRTAALLEGLPAAKQIGETKKPTLYRGAETEYDVGGRRVIISTYYQNRSFIRASLRVPGGPYPFVTVFPEGRVERLGKALGLNREVQSGDKEFDDLAYLDTVDTEQNVQRLVESAAVRAAMSDLLKLGFKVQTSDEGVEAFQLLSAREKLDASRAAEAIAVLGRLADTLPTFAGVSLQPSRSGRRLGLGLTLVFSWILGFIALALTSDAVSRTVDAGESVLVFLFGGGLAWLLYVIALVVGVRGKSYAMRTVLVGGFVGMLGIPGGGGGLVHWLNQKLDESAATERPRVVLQHKRLKNDCRLIVESWHPGGEQLRLFFKHDRGDEQPQAGSLVTVRTHPGAFGLEWIEPIRF